MSSFKLPPGITLPLPPDVYEKVMTLPAGTAPPGETTGYARPWEIYARGWSLVILATVIMTSAVGIRLFTRWHLPKRYLVEDYLIFASWVLFVAYAGITFECGFYGIGFHMWNSTVGDLIQALKIDGYLFILINILIKVAILLQFLQVFVPRRQVNQLMFFACWTMIAIVVIFYLTLLGLDAAECTPWEKIWNPLIPGHCVVDTVTLGVATAYVNVVTDAVILILPLPCIFQLNMAWKKKLGISSLFLIGILALHSPDASYYFGTLGFCTLFEMCSGALVLCLPTFPKFLTLIKEKVQSLRGSRSQSTDAVERQQMACENKAFPTRQPAAVNSLGLSSVDQYMGRGAPGHGFIGRISTLDDTNQNGSLDGHSGSGDSYPREKRTDSSSTSRDHMSDNHDEYSSYV